MDRISRLILILILVAAIPCALCADNGPVTIEWKENWDETYSANRARWEKEIPPKSKKPDYVFQNRLIFLLDSMLEKWPDEKAKRPAAFTELAELLTQINARGRACGALKKLVEESRGQPEAALQALLGILKIYPKQYETDEARIWQEYAARRLIAMNRVGYLSASHPAYGDALECFLIACSAQGRFLEASQTLELIKNRCRPDDRIKFQEAELYFRLGHIEPALRAYQDLSFFKQDRLVQQRIAQLSSLRWSSTAQQQQAFSAEIDKKWQALALNVIDNLPEADALARDDSEGKSIIANGSADGGRYASLWSVADEHFRAHAGKLGALKASHAGEAEGLLNAARKSGALNDLLRVFRKYPWSQAAQEALLEYGERQLLLGHAGFATRAFDDVLRHSAAPELRGQAQVGLWLAKAQDPANISELKRAADALPADSMLAWKGKPTAARAILSEILAGTKSNDETKSSTRRAAMQLPAIMPWPAEMVDGIPPEFRPYMSWPGMELTSGEGRLLLSAPNLLMCFGDDLRNPLWIHAPSRQAGLQGQLEASRAPFFYAPAPVRPAIESGVVYTRWGLDASRNYLSYVAAFDLRTGECLWSCERDPVWQNISALGDPTAADGMLYTLAIENGSSGSASALAIWLVCMDAKTGGFLWKRHLANHQLTSLPQSDEREERKTKGRVRDNQNYADVFHYGNAVTVRDGAVFCSTNCGVIARVDARDGVVEWLTTYSRSTPNARVTGFLRREGSAPMVSGETLVCIPRDYEGALGLNKETGKIAWENPFAASRQAVAMSNGAAILCDTEYLVSIDAASGKLRWFRSFNGEIAARPLRNGSSICVATQKAMLRISMDSGVNLEELRDDKQSAPAILAIHNGALVSAPGNPARPFPSDESISPKTAPDVNLALPLDEIWELNRANPELIVRPDRRERVYLASEGLLECVDTASGKIAWQRFVSPGVTDTAWTSKLLLLIYARHIQAIDAESGEIRWTRATPFATKSWMITPSQLVIQGAERIKPFGAIDLETGALLWTRSIDGLPARDISMIFDGGLIQLYGCREGDEYTILLLNPLDGSTAGTRPFTPKREPFPRAMTMAGSRGALVTDRLVLQTITLENGKPILRPLADLKEAMRRSEGSGDGRYFNWDWRRKNIAVNGPWIDIEQNNDRAQRAVHWIFKAGDPDYMLRALGRTVIQGDNLYYATEKALCVLDLPSKREVLHYTFPVTVFLDKVVRVVDFWKDDDAMVVVHGVTRSEMAGGIAREIDEKPGELQIDVFDARTGAHRQGQVFTHPAHWKVAWKKLDDNRDSFSEEGRGTQAVAAGGLLLLTGSQGLYAFAPAAAGANAGRAAEPSLTIVHRHTTQPAGGMGVTDWTDSTILPSSSPPANGQAAGGLLIVAHDSENLHIAATVKGDGIRPRRGVRESAIGDCLELGFDTSAGRFHGYLSVDARGRCNWESAKDSDAIAGTFAMSVRTDLAKGTCTYELAIPLRTLVRQDDPDWRTLGLSAMIWKQEAAGPRKVVEWGGALAGEPMASTGHARIYLDSASVPEEEAVWNVVTRYPELAASRAFLKNIAANHGSSKSGAATFLSAHIKKHPNDASTEALLALFDPLFSGVELADIAKAGGVGAELLARYSARKAAYLSQWVYLDSARLPSMIMLQLNDGASWEHRMSWGDFEWPLLGIPGTPSRRLGGTLPAAGSWQVLRVPLLTLGLSETPISGISFAQHGGGRVFWGRTAIVVGGKETIVIDGALPDGTKEGNWEWSDEMKQGGARAHFNRLPLSADEPLEHGIAALKKPIDAHVIKRDDRPRDSAELAGVLESEIPKMGLSLEAVSFLQELLALNDGDSENVVKRLSAFLNKVPLNPGNVEILGQLLTQFKALKRPAAEDDVEALIKSCKLPQTTAYEYRRKFVFKQRTFVRNWQVLGPFADPVGNAHETTLPPEGKPVDIAAHVQAGDAVLNWSALKSERDYIDLAAALKSPEHAVAFAACWVKCDKARSVMLEISADDACKVWLNQKPVHAHRNPRGAKAGDHRIRVFLTTGINEILIKVTSSSDSWGFFFELTDPEGRAPLNAIKVFETPP